jgi:hypothetical protein
MGNKLVDIFNEAKNLGGLKAQIRLAILTSASSTKAAEMPDTPDNIASFKKSFEVIKKEFAVS